MQFKEFQPSESLKSYVKTFYLFQSNNSAEFSDTVFPSGNLEIIFNLGEGKWESMAGERFEKTPLIELWGQITRPLAIRSQGKHCMLGVKFHPHSAACFFEESVSMFNDQVTDLTIIAPQARALHQRLLDADDTNERIRLLEEFLLQQLIRMKKKFLRIEKVAGILNSIRKSVEECSLNDIAFQYGISTRYLHKLVYRHTGLSPKSLNKIDRFQRSLSLISKNIQPLTSIAYDCGYFDQSHFIRDFKSFTTVTPSVYMESRFPVNQISFK